MSRTTLDIDDDMLAAVKERAAGEGTTTGKVISELVREALTRSLIGNEKSRYRNGFRLLPRTGQIITSEMVRKWLDEDV